MKNRFQRYTTKCKVLFTIPALVILVGCGNNAPSDSFETMENEILNAVEEPTARLTPMEIYEDFLNGEITIEKDEPSVLYSQSEIMAILEAEQEGQ